MKLTKNSKYAMYQYTICCNSQTTQPSWVPSLHTLVKILRNITQFGKFKMLDANAATSGARSTHGADVDVTTVAYNGLTQLGC